MLMLSVEADNLKDLVSKTLKVLGVDVAPATAAPAAPPVTPPAPPAPSTKRTKAQIATDKIKAAPPTPVEDPFAAGDAPAPGPEVTFQQMKDALQKLAQLRPKDTGNAGLQRATKVLETVGVKKIKDVKPEDFAKIIEACEGFK